MRIYYFNHIPYSEGSQGAENTFLSFYFEYIYVLIGVMFYEKKNRGDSLIGDVFISYNR